MWAIFGYGLLIDATNTTRHKVDSIPVAGGLQLLSICSMPKLIPAFLVSLVITLVVKIVSRCRHFVRVEKTYRVHRCGGTRILT
jgi:hypothetical protein